MTEIEMKFDEAKKSMVKYLKSEEFADREDAKTTLPAMKVLQEINKHGYITTNSQIGDDYNGFNPETKNYYRIRERAYLEGFMKKSKALELIEEINSKTDKVAYFMYANPDPEFEKLYFKSSSKEFPKIGVTISGTSKKSVEDIKKYGIFTFLSTVLPLSTFHFYLKQAKINKTENVVWVSIYDPVYGRNALGKNGLFKVVLEALQK
jgi:hypothetical protein